MEGHYFTVLQSPLSSTCGCWLVVPHKGDHNCPNLQRIYVFIDQFNPLRDSLNNNHFARERLRICTDFSDECLFYVTVIHFCRNGLLYQTVIDDAWRKIYFC